MTEMTDSPYLGAQVRLLVKLYRERAAKRQAELDTWRDEDGDVSFDDLSDYDEARADANQDAKSDLDDLLDELDKWTKGK